MKEKAGQKRTEINIITLMEFILLYKVYQFMQKDNKTVRRKRKDPQSRDYLCKCGKSYLSYAAAYTHVKNKHHLDKDYVENITKPEREQLKRGRPKQKKENGHSLQTSLLTLIESAILKICNQIQNVFEKTILQGNQERDQYQFNYYYQTLCKSKYDQLSVFQLQDNQSSNEFAQKLNKDFSCQIACKIKLITVIISTMKNETDNHFYLQKLNELNLWKDKNGVNEIIIETYQQWRRLYHYQAKAKQQDDDDQY